MIRKNHHLNWIFKVIKVLSSFAKLHPLFLSSNSVNHWWVSAGEDTLDTDYFKTYFIFVIRNSLLHLTPALCQEKKWRYRCVWCEGNHPKLLMMPSSAMTKDQPVQLRGDRSENDYHRQIQSVNADTWQPKTTFFFLEMLPYWPQSNVRKVLMKKLFLIQKGISRNIFFEFNFSNLLFETFSSK